MESHFCCHHADQVISSSHLHNRYQNNIKNDSMSSSSSSSLFLPSSSPPPSLLQQSYSPSSSSPALVGGGGGGEAGAGYIEHVVSKFDTLAGVAIKYGVEVRTFIPIFISSSPFFRFFFPVNWTSSA